MFAGASKGKIVERFIPVLLVLTVLLAFVIGVLWQKVANLEKNGVTNTNNNQAVAQAAPTQAPVTIDKIKNVFKANVIKFGDEKRKVLFVEIVDPSCPYCHVAGGKDPELNNQIDPAGKFKLTTDGGTYDAPVPEMQKLVDQGKASYALIYSPGHGNGEMGMKALYCAFDMGKFWEVNDLIMNNAGYTLMNNKVLNDKTKAGDVASFLSSVVDPTKMETCIKDAKWDGRLADDMKLASEVGSGGTPNFFVNTANFPGAYNFADMKSAVDVALK